MSLVAEIKASDKRILKNIPGQWANPVIKDLKIMYGAVGKSSGQRLNKKLRGWCAVSKEINNLRGGVQ